MSTRQLPSHEAVTAALDYNPNSGVFRWKIQPGRRVSIGSIAGSDSGRGYRAIVLYGRKFKAHRLAWFITYGNWPRMAIDHINTIRDDNRISNLRESTSRENSANRRVANKSGHIGVTRHPGNRWIAKIKHRGQLKYLGTFKRPADAGLAYMRAASEIDGAFLGFREELDFQI